MPILFRHAAAVAAVIAIPCFASVAMAQTVKSPASIQKALTVLNRVTDHTRRLVEAKNYATLPHENEEIKEGAEALEKSLAGESPDFKKTVEPLLKSAVEGSQHVTDAAMARDDAKLKANFETFAASVRKLFAAFPDNVQPLPPNSGQQKAGEKPGK